MEQLPTSAVGMLRALMTTQSQVDSFSDQVIESIKNGEINALEVLIQLRAFEKASERIIKETKDNYLKEANAYPETSFSVYGATVTKADTRTVYDYTVCKDPIWDGFAREKALVMDAMNQREAFLKTLKVPLTVVDEKTGEVTTIHPPVVQRTAGLKISIK